MGLKYMHISRLSEKELIEMYKELKTLEKKIVQRITSFRTQFAERIEEKGNEKLESFN